jgi:hypothetical protein
MLCVQTCSECTKFFITDSGFCPSWRGECNLKKWKEHTNIYLHVKYTCTNTIQFVRCDPWPAREEKERSSGERRQLFKFMCVYVTEGKGCYGDRSYVSDILRPRRGLMEGGTRLSRLLPFSLLSYSPSSNPSLTSNS